MIPEDAIFETILAPGVALYDVSHLLPTARKKYTKRPFEKIVRAYFHHSGSDGSKGYQGAYNTTNYVVKKRNFRGAAYTFWFPYEEVTDADGNYVVFRLNKDETRSYHTGKVANTHGIGCCFQGNLSKKPMSAFQTECAEAFIPWIMGRYDLDEEYPISYHSEAGKFGGKEKPTCPGPYAVKWVQDYRNNM